MKKIGLAVLVFMVSLVLVGCSLGGDKQKTYSTNGFKVTMDEGFYEKDLISATLYLESNNAIMTALKEKFTDLSAVDLSKDSKLDDYIELVMTVNKATGEPKKSSDGKYQYFTYEKEVSGKTFYYQATVVKGSDAFWLVNFACLESEKADFQEKFLKWADSIVVE